MKGQTTIDEMLRSYGVPLVHTPSGISVAIAAREDAIARVDKNANEEWKQHAFATVRSIATRRSTFTTDDVWALIESSSTDPTTHEPRAMGAIMRRAAKEGVIEPTDEYSKSTRKECHARPIRVWRSLIF